MKFAALGRTKWLYDALGLAQQKGHHCVLIATAKAAPEYAVSQNDFAAYAKSIGCSFIFDSNLDRREHLATIDQSGADVAISVNWPSLINEKVRSKFPNGVLNAHCGDLPRYRGNACPNWAILNGEEEVVVSIHEMVDELDAGPIFLQDRMPLTEATYIGDVYRWLDKAIPHLFVQVLDKIESGSITPREQSADPLRSLRCFPRLPEDGLINWERPAIEIVKLVRASAEPFAGAFTFLNNEKCIVWRASHGRLEYPYSGVPGQVVERRIQTGEVVVLAGEGALILQEVETHSFGRGKGCDIVRSTRTRLKSNLYDQIEVLRREVERLSDISPLS